MYLWVPIGLAIIVTVAAVFVYNTLAQKRLGVMRAWKQLQAQLRKRHEIVPNLVDTALQNAPKEQVLIDNLSQARSVATASASLTIADQVEAEVTMTDVLADVLALDAEYPALKASPVFVQLQRTVAGLNDRIEAARVDYEKAVEEYNSARLQKPARWFVNMMKFGPASQFRIDAAPEQGEQVAEKE
jgi:LemA protein